MALLDPSHHNRLGEHHLSCRGRDDIRRRFECGLLGPPRRQVRRQRTDTRPRTYRQGATGNGGNSTPHRSVSTHALNGRPFIRQGIRTGHVKTASRQVGRILDAGIRAREPLAGQNGGTTSTTEGDPMRTVIGWIGAMLASALLGAAVYESVLSRPVPPPEATASVEILPAEPLPTPTVYRTKVRKVVDPTPTVTIEEVVEVPEVAVVARSTSTRAAAPEPARTSAPTAKAKPRAAAGPAKRSEKAEDHEKAEKPRRREGRGARRACGRQGLRGSRRPEGRGARRAGRPRRAGRRLNRQGTPGVRGNRTPGFWLSAVSPASPAGPAHSPRGCCGPRPGSGSSPDRQP